MSRVITFSRVFPSYHPRRGESTYFVEKVWKSLGGVASEFTTPFINGTDFKNSIVWGYQLVDGYKHHTIRSGHRFKAGDFFSPRVWSGVPYKSKQIIFAPDIEVSKVWGFEIKDSIIRIRGSEQSACGLYDVPANEVPFIAANDGLSFLDLMHWFKFPKDFEGQIICWNGSIEY